VARRSLRLPATFSPTHQTAGLAGFPAIDVFGNPGEQVLAPVSGALVDQHMIPWNLKQRVGGETVYLQGDDGKTYFLTHLQGNVPSGRVQAGEPIGQVGAVPQNAWQPHIHEGAYQGTYNPGGSSSATSSAAPSSSGANPALLVQALSQHPGLDPQAVLAVAKQEGLGGGIGDNGTSFGPFQLHYGGAYPSWAPQGQQASQQWAWSPEGIKYALNQIAPVARGLKGQQAISNIVTRFERPADPSSEIAKAVGAYGQSLPAAAAPAAPGSPASVGALGAAPVAAAPVAAAPAVARPIPAAVRAALQILRA
jgi:hypothetical protein